MSAQSLRITIDKELERIARIEEPTRRGKELRAVQRVLSETAPRTSLALRVVVRELREEYSYSWQDVADTFGVSRARAQQIGTA